MFIKTKGCHAITQPYHYQSAILPVSLGSLSWCQLNQLISQSLDMWLYIHANNVCMHPVLQAFTVKFIWTHCMVDVKCWNCSSLGPHKARNMKYFLGKYLSTTKRCTVLSYTVIYSFPCALTCIITSFDPYNNPRGRCGMNYHYSPLRRRNWASKKLVGLLARNHPVCKW